MMSEDNLLGDNSPAVDTSVEAVEPTSTDDSFISKLPEELRNEASLGDFKDLASLAKSYVSAQRMLGGSLRIPGEDASDEARSDFYSKLESVGGVIKLPTDDNPEDMGRFYNRLGRPETAEGYEFETGDLEVNTEAVEGFKDLAHTLCLNKKQAGALFEFEMTRTQSHIEAQQEAVESSRAILQERWGDAYTEKMAQAKAAVSAYSEQYPELSAIVQDHAYGTNPAFLSILADLGAAAVEGKSIPHAQTIKVGLSTPEDAAAQIKEIRANKDHPFNNPTSKDYLKASAKVRKLYEAIHGDEKI